MTLTTHALVGAAAASLFPGNPLLAFSAGFVSHFAIDALPHWDYGKHISSWEIDRDNPINSRLTVDKKFFKKDFVLFCADALIGLTLSVFVFCVWYFHLPPFIISLGAIAGLLPDALSSVFLTTHWPLLRPLQTFHIWIQKGRQLEGVSPLVGLSLQALMVVLFVVLLRWFY